MLLTRKIYGRGRRARASGVAAASADIAGQDDSAKIFVLNCVGELVADGYAEWTRLDGGGIELRLPNGEVFLLGEAAITRLV
jgi:hypothetical protein